MAKLSSLLDNFQPSAISEIFTLAGELKSKGHDIIDLSVGEPDFPTPEHVKRAGIDAINDDHTKYTNVAGTTALRNAVARKFKRDNGLEYSASQIVIDSGAKPLLFHALEAMLEADGEVILPTPCWASYSGMVTLTGGVSVFVPCLQEDGFKLQPSALEAAINENTSVVMLNSPSNPTGAAYSAEEMKALTNVLLRHPHVWVIADDIYEHIAYDGFKFVTPAQIEPKLYDRTLTINGVSKAYSMTGWRIGFAGGPQELIDGIVKILSQNNGNPSSISQIAAIAALDGPQSYVADRAVVFKERRDYFLFRIGQMRGLNCHAPEGAFYLYPNCQNLIGLRCANGIMIENSTDLARYFLEDYNIAVVPGAAFDFDPHIRISYATSMENLIKACDRMSDACNALR
jgi:aspartate aminotransferase